MRTLILGFLAALSFASFSSPPLHAQTRPARIYSQFLILPRADFAEFEAVLSRTLAQSRQQLEGEFMGMMEPLAYMTDDLPGLAMVLGRLMEQFETMAKIHRAEVHAGVPTAFADEIIAAFDQSYRELGISDDYRRAQFVDLSENAQAALHKLRSGQGLTPNEAQTLRSSLDYLVAGGYSVLPGGLVSVSLRLVDVHSGRIHSFSVRARASAAGAVTGREVFEFFQANRYAQWENPAPQLSWLPQPAPAEPVLPGIARMACRTQGARLPYARELIQASMATEVRPGGISRLLQHVDYIVGDRQRFDEQHYYTTGSNGVTRTGGPVHTSAGLGRVTGYFWCVKGSPSSEVIFFENLYRVIRKVRATPATSRDVVQALEYILASLEDFGASQDSQLRFRFGSLEEAVALLSQHGITVNIPDGL